MYGIYIYIGRWMGLFIWDPLSNILSSPGLFINRSRLFINQLRVFISHERPGINH